MTEPLHPLVIRLCRLLTEAVTELERLQEQIKHVANECNCRYEHGAEGEAHLRAIETMLNGILAATTPMDKPS